MNTFLILPFVALFATQFIKMAILAGKGKFSWKEFDSYGGMPSAHSAFMAVALTEAVQVYGISTPIFAIIAFLTFIVLRDAVGIRKTIGLHAEMLNRLIKDLPDNLEYKYPFLETRQGHKYSEIIVGLLIGLIIALII